MTKVLILSLDNVGDTVLSLAVYEAVKARPGFDAALWTKDYSGEIVSLYSETAEHYHCDPYWDKSPGKKKGKLLRFLKTLWQVRRARFDAAIILHSNWRKNLACLLAGIPLRYAANGAFANHRLNVGQRDAHVLDTSRRLVEAATGADPGPLRCSIPRPVRPASEQAKALSESGSWAVIHPFSGNPRRNLPLAAWKPLLAGLAARGLKIFVNASPAEKELLQAAAGTAVPLAFSCDSTHELKDLAYLISRARIFIGNNSGPLHLASALGTPCVGVYERREVDYIEPRGVRLPRLLIFETSPEEITSDAVAAEIARVLEAGN